MPNRKLYYVVGMSFGALLLVGLFYFNMGILSGKEIMAQNLILPFSVGLFMGFLVANTLLYYKTLKILNARESLLRQYKEAVDSCLIVSKTDLKGVITYANTQFEEISGYTQSELLGRMHNLVRHPEVPKSVYKELWETIQSKKIWKGILHNRSKNGSNYTVSATVIPLLNVDGTISEYLSLRTDVTELERLRLQAQKALEESTKDLHRSEQELSEHQKALNIAAIFTRMDLNGVFIHANDNFLNLLGYELDEIVGAHCHTLAASQKEEIFHEIIAQMQDEKFWKGVVHVRTKAGATKIFEVEFIPIFDQDHRMTEMMNFYHDLTDFYALNDEIEKTQKEVIFTLGSVVESRSKETANHVIRVAEISSLIALKYGLTPLEVDLIRHASPMHDIGKIGIEDAILSKAASLTPQEFARMKEHAAQGYEMLKSSKRALLQTAAIIAHEHHEKYDGSGYPRGLKGEEIHIYGRIVAIADVFDALRSKRCYKEPWPLEEVLNYFEANRNKHFDGKLVDILFRELDAILEIEELYKDL